MSTTRDALVAALGADRVRDAGPDDEVAGARPRWVASVDSTASTAQAMTTAAEHGLRVVARGSGSALDRGGPPTGLDLLLDLSAVTGVVEHAAGDLVVRVAAGTPLAEVQRVVGAAGQQLALDAPAPTSTVGGIIATGAAGPGAHLYGGVRDLLIGITVVRADGTPTTSGGKVVKNVAGYDLGKLYTGSFGTLGVITEAVFRLHPLAAEHRWIRTRTTDPGGATALLRRSQAVPTAIELDRPDPHGPTEVCAHLEGGSGATDARARALAAELGPDAEVLDRAPDWWGAPLPGTALRLGAAPARLGALLDDLAALAPEAAVRGSAGRGVLHAGLPGTTDLAARVGALRDRCDYVVVERDPHADVDPWGPIAPGALALMRRTKDQFDPEHRLAPGRFVGGI
ncbi:FAD-binding oxidoreductase [Saccharopolyspora sp. CA-218241]|uniref:FAD-binding oxidoreductase n=1 Tax=Saccharopolyspora sp. CA-218241 TaxID=3240027 RepID=UPI003D96A6B9